MITLANADKALKTYYLDAVASQLDAISPFYAAIDKHSTEVYGKEVKVAVVKPDNTRVVAGTEDGDLPAAGSNRYVNLTSTLKNIYGTIEISDKALRASQNSSGAFVDLLNAEMEGLISSAKVNFSRMLYGDGNGYVGTITKTSGSTLTVEPIGRVYEGMSVDIRSGSGILEAGEDLTVASVDYANGTITLSSTPDDTLTGSSVYVHGAYGNEITGFRAIFGTGDIYGLTRSSESLLNPVEFTLATLSESGIMENINYMEAFCNNRPNMILCSYKTKSAIGALLTGAKMQLDTAVLNGGYSAILFDGIPVVADRYCPDDSIYLINTDDFVLAQLCDWAWLEDEDGKILKQVPGKAAYSATLVKYAELICKRPCAQGVITGF
ncbi:MAG TPA: phage major capsid protein [Candidatus Coproplasma stercoripullorum]|uniref:Phage major capsid protein n=1 Tax=Candidatus Coproplasma stercoripullorum TaxID=2840751 RepID=A0A9D1AGU0_9FIRM|nr:phage major capsid protein [Candidatus Coproplasma stercoripullorum]